MAGPMRGTRRANFHSIDDLAQSDRTVQELLPLTELNFNLTGCTCYPMFGMEHLHMHSSQMDSLISRQIYDPSRKVHMPRIGSALSDKPSFYGKDNFTLHQRHSEYSENKHQQGKLRKYRKQRIVFEPTQLKVLEDMFALNAYPSSEKFEHISKLTMVDEARLRIWFQNRRARCRKLAKNTNL